METRTLYGIVIGAGVGWVIGQVLLMFFMDEIFNFINRTVYVVRKACGLD